AIKDSDMNILKFLISRGANIDHAEPPNGMTPLLGVAWRGNLEVVDLLITSGCNIRAQVTTGNYALHQAAHQGHSAVVEKLVQAGLPVDIRGSTNYTPLFYTISPRFPDTMATLLRLGADPNAKCGSGFAVLHHAAENGFPDTLELLLKYGADPNVVDPSKRTPLQAAAQFAQEATFRLLLEANTNVNNLHMHGWNVLHHAAFGGSVSIGKLLISNTSLKEVRDSLGMTPFLIAAQQGSASFLRFLLEEGVDRNARTNEGENAIIKVAQGKEAKHVEAAKMLLELRYLPFDVNSTKTSGHTPLMLAAEMGHAAMVQLLLKHGAS
ncbi:ankyrin, partial [Zopfia rhizophila CBS 207.26]